MPWDDHYPHPSSAAVSAVMRGNQKTGSKPEIVLRSVLHREGLRFRKNLLLRAGSVKVRPDIVFTKRRLAVFVDGCFWHCCPIHGNVPQSNREYWRSKLARNVERDKEVTRALVDCGWSVIRIWEHVASEVAAAEVKWMLQRR